MDFTNGKDILEYYKQKGIVLWLDNRKLKYKAPQMSLSDEHLQVLKKYKTMIIDYLENQKDDLTVVADKGSRFEVFPMSDVQTAYLLGRKDTFEYGGVACHVYLEIHYDALNPEKVRKAWNALIARHEMLRAVMGESGYQQILEAVPSLDIPYFDIAEESINESERIRSVRKEMGHRMYALGQWPMFGIAVSKHNKGATLHFSMEFLIADWTSIWLLLWEFESMYFTSDKKLPGFELSFRDYLLAERRLKDTELYERDRDYWMKRIDDLPAAPELPLLKAPDIHHKPTFKRLLLKMDRESWRAFKNNAQKCGVTPTVAVLAVYADIIERWSRNKRFCINLTVLNRLPLHQDIDKVVGDFTTVSLLAVDRRKDGAFIERAKEINSTLFEDLDHRLYTGIEVIRELTRRGRKSSLMPIVFTSAIGLIDSNHPLVGKVEGYGISQTPQVFIDCQAMDGNFGLQINWDVREDIFPEGMVEDMFRVFEKQLHELANSLDAWHSAEYICLPERQKQERAAVNETARDLPKGLLYSKFVEQVKLRPDQMAVEDGKGRFTYAELDEWAKAIAFEIVKQGGKKQDRIAVVMEKSRYQAAAVLGILYMGGVYVPIDDKQAESRRNAILDNVESRMVLGLSNTQHAYKEGICRIDVDTIAISAHFDIVETEADLPAYIIYTSGSTGVPKGVVITHEAALNTIEDMNAKFQASDRDKVLGISQLNFDLSVFDVFGMLSVGGGIIYPEVEHYLNPSYWTALVEKHHITIWNSVPALMRMLLTHLQTETVKRTIPLRLALLSGDWIPLDMPEQLIEQIPGIEVICLGGATEASIWSIYHRYEGLKKDWVSIPYGKPLANQSFRILDRKLKDCPVWVPGELYIAGDGLAVGYYGDVKMTESRFFNHPFDGQRIYRTGDMGRYLPGGEIEFLGREDNQVKIRGHRIELGEIECAIRKHSAVAAAVAFVEPDKDEICAAAEPAFIEGYDSETADRTFDELTGNIEEGAQHVIEKLEDKNMRDVLSLRNKASLISLLYALQNLGFFKSEGYDDIDALLHCKEIREKYRWLMRPWISSLEKAGLINKKEDKLYRAKMLITEEYRRELWEEVRKRWIDELGSSEIIDYIRLNAENLVEILKGTIDPLGLLYTGVDTGFTRALYVDNTMAIYLNKCICEFVKKVAAENHNRKLRILEIGAGSGATTEHVLNSLEGLAFEYYFTDVTKYFFSNARKKFGERKEVIIKAFDIDRDYIEQGFAPNSFDIVIGAYVLENAKDIEKSIERIEELLMPQGYFLFSAPLRDEEWLLISQALMMTVPEDKLRENAAFMAQDDWLKVLQRHGNNKAAKVIPEKDSNLSCLGLNLFIKQFKRERAKITSEDMKEHLSSYLPDYMNPVTIQFMNRLPLTANGKIDRHKAAERVKAIIAPDTSIGDMEHLDDALEIKLGAIWCEALKIEKIGKSQNFYDFGADSLMMAQAATKIRNQMGIDIPFETLLRQMLNHPTISELGQFICNEKKKENTKGQIEKTCDEAAEEKNDFAYIQHYGGDVHQRKRVILHGALGSVDSFRYLGPALAAQEQGEVMAIGISDLEKYCSLNPVEVLAFLADHYSQLLIEMNIKNIQLIGYSFSGAIAIEMAKRLVEKGVEVEDVAIIDSVSMLVEIQEELMYELLFVDNIHVALSDLGFKSKDMLEKVFEKLMSDHKKTVSVDDFEVAQNVYEVNDPSNMLHILKHSTQEERFKIYEKLSEKNGGNKIPANVIAALYRIFTQSFKALQVLPDAYFGDIRYFFAKEKEGIFKYFKFLLNDWEQVCLGNFLLEEIEGNHYSCVEEKKNAVSLAKAIGRVYG